jgi:hypothetical protein
VKRNHCSLSVVVLSLFTQAQFSGLVEVLFLTTGLGCDSVVKHSPSTQGTGPEPQHCSDQGRLAGVLCRELVVGFCEEQIKADENWAQARRNAVNCFYL